MEVMPLMTGAQGEKVNKAYKEGDGSHGRHVWIIIFIMVCYHLFLSLAI